MKGSSSITVRINPPRSLLSPYPALSWVHHSHGSLSPSTTMKRFFKNKRKKSPKPSPQGILPTTPTDIAAGPVRHQVQSNIGPEGGQTRSYQGSEVDRSDLTVALDGRTGGGSRIVFQDRTDEDQVLPVSVASTSAVVIGGTGRRNNRTSTADPCDWN